MRWRWRAREVIRGAHPEAPTVGERRHPRTASVALYSSVSCLAASEGCMDAPFGAKPNQACSLSKPSPPGLPGSSFGPAMYPSRDIDM